jgi:hypothetical protein
MKITTKKTVKKLSKKLLKKLSKKFKILLKSLAEQKKSPCEYTLKKKSLICSIFASIDMASKISED